MYYDIEELIKEIEIFRSNVKDSNQLWNILSSISENLNSANIQLSEKYKECLAEINLTNDNIEKQSGLVIKEYLDIVEKQKKEMREKYQEYLFEINQTNTKIEKQSNEIIKEYLGIVEKQKYDLDEKYNGFLSSFSKQFESSVAQTNLFEKKSEEILGRLKGLEIESLLIEIRKVNKKISLLLGVVIFGIILSIIVLFIR